MNDQPAYVTREEFERRMRVLEGEVEGEKLVTRHILEQTRRNGDDLATLKTDSALMRAELTRHSALLNVLTQDVTMLRTDMTQLRRDTEQLRADMDAKFDAVLVAVRAIAPRPPGE
jgi:hypothetical protein